MAVGAARDRGASSLYNLRHAAQPTPIRCAGVTGCIVRDRQHAAHTINKAIQTARRAGSGTVGNIATELPPFQSSRRRARRRTSGCSAARA
jgi:hypothetical protein